MIKSPFLIIRKFISPLECENIITSIDIITPNYDEQNFPIKTMISVPVIQNRIWTRFEHYFDIIENYYGVGIESVSDVSLEWYPEGCSPENLRCENSVYSNNKWHMINDHDFTAIIFLKDYNSETDFDVDFECYGGELAIQNHGFSIKPERGTAIVFPANQYFIHKTESPTYGESFQLRTHLICSEKFNYNPSDYEGNYKKWFKDLT